MRHLALASMTKTSLAKGKIRILLLEGIHSSAVDFPEVALPEHPGKHRLLHIHRNQPGVLSAINAVFSGEKINVAGQYLQTNPKIGSVVIDVETGERAASLDVKGKLEQVPGTIRTRILY